MAIDDRDGGERMSLLSGINHVATLTSDIDRLLRFYKRMFDADVLFDGDIPLLAGKSRHAFIELGPSTALHIFQIPGNDWPTKKLPIFDRGRVDHIAIGASTQDALEEIRQRLVAEGASDGSIVDFGAILSVFFRDPDGMECEVCWLKDGASFADARAPANFRPRGTLPE